MSRKLSNALFLFGYPVSIAVITRFKPVVKERRWKWLAVHHAAVSAIVTGRLLRHDKRGAVVNGAWLVSSSLWYALGGRSR